MQKKIFVVFIVLCSETLLFITWTLIYWDADIIISRIASVSCFTIASAGTSYEADFAILRCLVAFCIAAATAITEHFMLPTKSLNI